MIEYREEILDHPIEMAALKYLAAEGWELVLGELVQQPLPWSRRYLFKRQQSEWSIVPGSQLVAETP